MKTSYALLAVANLLLMAMTAGFGLWVEGRHGFARHFLLGVLTGLFTCFVHVVLFIYFVVQEKIITQSILHHGLDSAYSSRAQAFKARALRLSMIGVGSIILTSALGAAVGIAVDSEPHLVAAFATMLLNAVVFFRQYSLLHDYGEMFGVAFGEEPAGN